MEVVYFRFYWNQVTAVPVLRIELWETEREPVRRKKTAPNQGVRMGFHHGRNLCSNLSNKL